LLNDETPDDQPTATGIAAMTALATPSSTRTVERALSLLAEVCDEGALSLAECARRVQLPASTALRLLRTLEAAGFVTRGGDGSFRAGTRVIQLGALALGRQPLVGLAQPRLESIVERTGESAYLAIRGPADTAVYVAMVEGTRTIRHTSWVGRAIAFDGLAVGAALTGDIAPAHYLSQRDPSEPDVTAIAAPVRWPGGVAGALNLIGPTYRIDEAALHSYGRIVADEAAAMSVELGAPAPAAPPAAPPAGPSARPATGSRSARRPIDPPVRTPVGAPAGTQEASAQ
jgi:IclR family transcriptional regulator, acetate operon repressor